MPNRRQKSKEKQELLFEKRSKNFFLSDQRSGRDPRGLAFTEAGTMAGWEIIGRQCQPLPSGAHGAERAQP
jgi:hypothetical protein